MTQVQTDIKKDPVFQARVREVLAELRKNYRAANRSDLGYIRMGRDILPSVPVAIPDEKELLARAEQIVLSEMRKMKPAARAPKPIRPAKTKVAAARQAEIADSVLSRLQDFSRAYREAYRAADSELRPKFDPGLGPNPMGRVRAPAPSHAAKRQYAMRKAMEVFQGVETKELKKYVDEQNTLKETYRKLVDELHKDLPAKERERIADAWYLQYAVESGVPPTVALDTSHRIGSVRNAWNAFIKQQNRVLTIPRNLTQFAASTLAGVGLISKEAAIRVSDWADKMTEGTIFGQSYQDALERFYQTRPPENAFERGLLIASSVASSVSQVMALSPAVKAAGGAAGVVAKRALAGKEGVARSVLSALGAPLEKVAPEPVIRILGGVKGEAVKELLSASVSSALINAPDIDYGKIVDEYVEAGVGKEQAEKLAVADLAAIGLWRIGLDVVPLNEYFGQGMTKTLPLTYRAMALAGVEGTTEVAQDVGAETIQAMRQRSQLGVQIAMAPSAQEVFDTFIAGALGGGLIGSVTSTQLQELGLGELKPGAIGEALKVPRGLKAPKLPRLRKGEKGRTEKAQPSDVFSRAVDVLAEYYVDKSERPALEKEAKKNAVARIGLHLASQSDDLLGRWAIMAHEARERLGDDAQAVSDADAVKEIVVPAIDKLEALNEALRSDKTGDKVVNVREIAQRTRSSFVLMRPEDQAKLVGRVIQLSALTEHLESAEKRSLVPKTLLARARDKKVRIDPIGFDDLVESADMSAEDALNALAKGVGIAYKHFKPSKEAFEQIREVLRTPTGLSTALFLAGYTEAGGATAIDFSGFKGNLPSPLYALVHYAKDSFDDTKRRGDTLLDTVRQLRPGMAGQAVELGVRAGLQSLFDYAAEHGDAGDFRNDITPNKSTHQGLAASIGRITQKLRVAIQSDAATASLAAAFDISPEELRTIVESARQGRPDGYERWLLDTILEHVQVDLSDIANLDGAMPILYNGALDLESFVTEVVAEAAQVKETRDEEEGQSSLNREGPELQSRQEAQRNALRSEPGAQDAQETEQSYQVLLKQGGYAGRAVLATPKGDIRLRRVSVETGTNYPEMKAGVQARARGVDLNWTNGRIGMADRVVVGSPGASFKELAKSNRAVLERQKDGSYILYAPILTADKNDAFVEPAVKSLGAVVEAGQLWLRFDPITGDLLDADGQRVLFEAPSEEDRQSPATAALSLLLAKAPETSLPAAVARSHAESASYRFRTGSARVVLPRGPEAGRLKNRWIKNYKLLATQAQSDEYLDKRLAELVAEQNPYGEAGELDEPYTEDRDGRGVYANRRAAIVTERSVREEGAPRMADENAKHLRALLSMYAKARMEHEKSITAAAMRHWLAHLRASVAMDPNSVVSLYHDPDTGAVGLATYGASVEYAAESGVDPKAHRVASLYAKDLLSALEAMTLHGGPYTIAFGAHDVIKLTSLDSEAYLAAHQGGHSNGLTLEAESELEPEDVASLYEEDDGTVFANAPPVLKSEAPKAAEPTDGGTEPVQEGEKKQEEEQEPSPHSVKGRLERMTKREREIYLRARERLRVLRSARSRRGYFQPLHKDPLFTYIINKDFARAAEEPPIVTANLRWTRIMIELNRSGKLKPAQGGKEPYTGLTEFFNQHPEYSHDYDRLRSIVNSHDPPVTGVITEPIEYLWAWNFNDDASDYLIRRVTIEPGYYVLGKQYRNRREYIKALRKNVINRYMTYSQHDPHIPKTKFTLSVGERTISWGPLSRREVVKLIDLLVGQVRTIRKKNVLGAVGASGGRRRRSTFFLSPLAQLDDEELLRTALHELGHWITLINSAEVGEGPVALPTLILEILNRNLMNKTILDLMADWGVYKEAVQVSMSMRGPIEGGTENDMVKAAERIFNTMRKAAKRHIGTMMKGEMEKVFNTFDEYIRQRIRESGRKPSKELVQRYRAAIQSSYSTIRQLFSEQVKIANLPQYEYRLDPAEVMADAVAFYFLHNQVMRRKHPKIAKLIDRVFEFHPGLLDLLERFAEEVHGVKVNDPAEAFNVNVDRGYEESRTLYNIREAQREKLKKSFITRVMVALVDNAYAYINAARKGLIPKENVRRVRWAVEEMLSWASPVSLWLHRMQKSVFEFLNDATPYGGDWLEKHLNRRLVADAFIGQTAIVDIDRPFLRPESVSDFQKINDSMLPSVAAELQERFGLSEERALEEAGRIVDAISVAADRFRALLNAAVSEGSRNGLYSPKLQKVIQQNADVYAKLAEIDHYFQQIGWKIHTRKKRSESPGDAVFASMATAVEVLIHSRRNKAALRAIAALQASEIPHRLVTKRPHPAPKGTLENSKDALENPHWYFPHEGVVEAYDNGRRVFLIVPREYAAPFQTPDFSVFRQISNFMSNLFYNTLHKLYVNFNIKFAIQNQFRDLSRTAISLGLRIPKRKLLAYFKEGHKRARDYLIRGKDDPVIAEMLQSAALMPPLGSAQGVLLQEADPGTLAERLASTYGVHFYPKGKTSKVGAVVKSVPGVYKLLDRMVKVANAIPTFTSLAEYRHKVAMYLAIKEQHPDLSEEERAAIVRNRVGTPNYMRKGTHSFTIKPFLPYANVAIQSYRETLPVVMTNRRAFTNWLLLSFLPRFIWRSVRNGSFGYVAANTLGRLIALLLAGDDEDERNRIIAKMTQASEDAQEYLRAIPDYYHRAYVIFPIWFDPSTNKPIFLSIRDDELSAALANTILDLIELDRPAWNNLTASFADISLATPSINPYIDVTYKTWQYLSGVNPKSRLWGTEIIPNADFLAGFRYSIDDFLSYVFYQGGVLKQVLWDPGEAVAAAITQDPSVSVFEIVNDLTLGATGALLRVGSPVHEATAHALREKSSRKSARAIMRIGKVARAIHQRAENSRRVLSAMTPDQVYSVPTQEKAVWLMARAFDLAYYRPLADILKQQEALEEMGVMDKDSLRETVKLVDAAAKLYQDRIRLAGNSDPEQARKIARQDIPIVNHEWFTKFKRAAGAARRLESSRSRARQAAAESLVGVGQ